MFGGSRRRGRARSGPTVDAPRPGSALPADRLAHYLDRPQGRALIQALQAQDRRLDESAARAGAESLVRTRLDFLGSVYVEQMDTHIDALIQLETLLVRAIRETLSSARPGKNQKPITDRMNYHIAQLMSLSEYYQNHPGPDMAWVQEHVREAATEQGPSAAFEGHLPPDRPREIGADLLDRGRVALAAWRSGRTVEPAGRDPAPVRQPDHPALVEKMQEMARRMLEYERARDNGELDDLAAERQAVEELRRAVSDSVDALRWFGERWETTVVEGRLPPRRLDRLEPGSDHEPGSAAEAAARIRERVDPQGADPPRHPYAGPIGEQLLQASPAQLFDALHFDDVEVTAQGRVTEGVSRGGLEGYLLSARSLARLPTLLPKLGNTLSRLMDGWQRAHLVGPGFGAELFRGLALAPEAVNQILQNRGIERLLRQAASDYGEIPVTITGRNRRLVIPLTDNRFEYVDVMKSVRYELPDTALYFQIDVQPDGSLTVWHNLPPEASPWLTELLAKLPGVPVNPQAGAGTTSPGGSR